MTVAFVTLWVLVILAWPLGVTLLSLERAKKEGPETNHDVLLTWYLDDEITVEQFEEGVARHLEAGTLDLPPAYYDRIRMAVPNSTPFLPA